MTPIKSLGLTTLLIVGMTTGMASAKAHNQGNTEVPGTNVGSQTVSTSHVLGGIKGQRPTDKGPVKSKAVEKAE